MGPLLARLSHSLPQWLLLFRILHWVRFQLHLELVHILLLTHSSRQLKIFYFHLLVYSYVYLVLVHSLHDLRRSVDIHHLHRSDHHLSINLLNLIPIDFDLLNYLSIADHSFVMLHLSRNGVHLISKTNSQKVHFNLHLLTSSIHVPLSFIATN